MTDVISVTVVDEEDVVPGTGAAVGGARWYSDAGVPSPALGNSGDFYLDSTNGLYYEKVGDEWLNRGDLRSGDVFGPASSATDRLVIFANNSGKLLADSGIASDSVALVGHTHSIANVTGLQTALDGKASSAHTHIIANVTGLQTALDGKASDASASTSGATRFQTRAAFQAATIPGTVQSVEIMNYSSAGDGGGGLYRRVASAPTHEGKIQSADGAWWEYMPRGNRYSVKAFGAIGDGVADDTAALLNTYNAAIRTKGIVSLPSGTYICSGIDLGGAAHRSAIWEGEAYDGLGNPYLASCIKLRNASNRPIFTVLGGEMAQHIFRYIAFDGNLNQQSANEYIIKAVDDMVTAYPVGIHVQFCHFWYGRGGGIYLGKRRGWNYLENLSFYQCGLGNNGHGIFIDTFDVTMHNIHIGESGGYGLYMLAASQIQAHAVNCYVNQLGGIFIGAGVTDITFTNFSLDRNLRFGLNAVANTNPTYRGLRSFVNGRFLANSTIANGGFPDVMIGAGCDDIAFVGCSFMGDEGANKSAFAIQFADAAGRVRLAACRFAVKSKFSTTEWTNTYACLEGADLPGFADAAVSSVARALNANGAPVLVMSGASGAASHWQMGNDSSINPFLIPRGAAADINAVLRAKGQGVVFIGGGTTSQILASDVGVGFYNTAPVGKPTVTGSRGGNAALASLLSALASMGLITDSSIP